MSGIRAAFAAAILPSLTVIWADYRFPGGETTVFDDTREAFAQPLANLEPTALAQFFSGDTVFNTNWVNASSIVDGRDGLGPLFNAQSCSACHFKDGRGQPPSESETAIGLVVRISEAATRDRATPAPHPVYGNQVSVRALPGLEAEAQIEIAYTEIEGVYPDGESYRIQKPVYTYSHWSHGDPGELLTSPRVAPSVFGLGLIDRIPENEIRDGADPLDRDSDGISGRAHLVWSPSNDAVALGRYGWKANKTSILDQTAAAFQGDIGITSNLFPEENHSERQVDTALYPSGGQPELHPSDLEDVVFYLNTLAPPASRFESLSSYESGLELFNATGCVDCHRPTYETRNDPAFPALSGQTIHPYTDLLLHDMGPGLADGRPDQQASGSEWRTPPLWGIGLIPKVNGHSRLLHDGRARSIEEAILWHGGEAAQSQARFQALPNAQRDALIEFVSRL